MHVIIWAYEVSDSQRACFEEAYGAKGDWAELFRRADGYLGTELLRDDQDPSRYFTIDRWRKEADRERFMSDWGAAYRDLDKQCEAFTTGETLVGIFFVNATGGLGQEA
ncbi:MAG TPA: antibiotic biosynthesis monooxygenase [Amaricoccus sp.]|uniref:antibiotic biosynthesis monooxygenase family protein n=1 Tax=Amaricoccus sp. TaxID=1872485 RepID=UPI002CA1E71C|nr:antibiotic biosynthesis monooxygenase [Amaricoccus sp.]HMQ94861.1 antibiotic biosynthesis monooxygenase [Amaricoccus sp.]HMR54666.1 antibiotic biosynthesis monooxygenase [Amaricoccus sp.]HMU01712.1 antibiotic biosynthesis monooxygenase [Amaricoccus sp.]